MANYITVDGGTTNTRLYLVKNQCVVDTLKLTVGAGNGKAALTEAIQSFQFAGLESSGISFNVCGYGGPPALNARQGLSRPAASEDCTRT